MPWEEVEFKINEAAFFLQGMREAVTSAQSRRPSGQEAAILSTAGTQVGLPWEQAAFYYYLDAFLVAVRSIPDIIQWWFGMDPRAQQFPSWVEQLQPGEEARRSAFQNQFRTHYLAFNGRFLSRARVATMHRVGTPPAEVATKGRWDMEHRGSPTRHMPMSDKQPEPSGENPPFQPELPSHVLSVTPSLSDFELVERDSSGNVQRHPLFPACQDYLKLARDLVQDAHALAKKEHGTHALTPPPGA